MLGNVLQFNGDGSVFVGQICVVCTRVHDAQIVTGLSKVEGHLVDDGLLGIVEVDGNRASYGASHLVHKATGLSEEYVFSVLTDLSNGNGIDFVAAEQMVKDNADQYFVSCRRRQAGTL